MDKILSNTMLFTLLGEQGINELRSKLIDMIVDEVHDQLHEHTEYIIDPEDIREIVSNKIEVAVEAQVQEYKDVFYEQFKKAMELKMK